MQQPLEEALGCGGVSAFLHKDVEHDAMLVDGAPEVMQRVANTQENLVEVPSVTRVRPSPAQPGCKVLAESQAPAPDALVRDHNAALGQDQIDITQAEAENVVESNGMVGDLGREAVTGIGRALRG